MRQHASIKRFFHQAGNSVRLGTALLAPAVGLVVALSVALATTSAHSQTIVQLGTTYDQYSVKEGYAGDLDQFQLDVRSAKDHARPPAITTRHLSYRHGVYVSDVKTSVYSDLDHDGYYTHFDLTLDIDNHFGFEYVYARIYLRDDASDYALFHVTDVFEIYENLASDRYKISSKLVTNYDAALYDIRVEIFVAGKSRLEDRIDASTHRNLFALPLEADRLDEGPADSIVHEHAGASFLLLAPLGLLLLRRRVGQTQSWTGG